ncbi:MAG: hypothetical protein NZV14_08270 [Bryobacteraceae bacterium]|nr:hypothetical protein [Bryobacteraceae bacterium]MDW8378143.1 hypothetical protein [Bryobacterales bacterium]
MALLSLLALWLLTPTSLAETRPGIAVFMEFAEKPSGVSLQTMKQEVEALLEPAGLRLHWREVGNPHSQPEEFADIFVFRFNGRCHMSGVQFLFSELGPYGETVVLGTSKTVNHQILPFGSVECDSIRRTVTPVVIGLAHPQREKALGRAMGRVLAHELFHMMTRRSKHGLKGIYREAQRADYLVADEFGFDPEELAELRKRSARQNSLPQ